MNGLFKWHSSQQPELARAAMETLEVRRLLSAPIVTGPASRFYWNTSPQAVNYAFNENVLITNPAVQLTNLTTGADATSWLTRTSADNVAALNYRVDHTDQDGLAHVLDRGNYDLVLTASQVANGSDEPMSSDDLSSFFFQPGDINHDAP